MYALLFAAILGLIGMTMLAGTFDFSVVPTKGNYTAKSEEEVDVLSLVVAAEVNANNFPNPIPIAWSSQ
jgi:hypothetical protein